MNQRELVIIEMLRSRNDLIDEGRAGGAGLLGGYSHSFGPNFTAAFRELERLLDVMRAERPKQRRHVMARYVHAERRPIVVPCKREKRADKIRFSYRLPAHTEIVSDKFTPSIDGGNARVLVYQWEGWVKDQEAAKGVAWLATQHQGVPALPVELARAA